MTESDDEQPDGRHYVVFRYTHTESGQSWLGGLHRFPVGTNIQAVGDSQVDQQEAGQKEVERSVAWTIGSTGGDLDAETWNFNTLAEIRKYFFRRLFNLMRDAEVDPEKAQVCIYMSDPTSYMNKYSAAAIAGFIDDPAWNTPTTNGARANISAVGVNMAALDHGEAELGLEF